MWTHSKIAVLLTGLALAGLGISPVLAEDEEPEAPTTQPADAKPITTYVLDVKGDVQHTPMGSENWTQCKVDDEYPPETVIRTGVRSSIKLKIGDDDTYTAMVIDAATKTVLSEAYTTKDTKRVRIGVGYGKVRAGVVEGGLKSDFTVDSPVATLSKRGTWNFGLFYERGTGRFEIFLIDNGLVNAFDRVTDESRNVLPGEMVNELMLRWFEEVQLQRNVPIPDILGQGDIEVAFNTLENSGLRVLDPSGGHSVLIDLSASFSSRAFAFQAQTLLPPPFLPRPRQRLEGYFGTGRADQLIPFVIDTNSPLAQKGFAKPGTYRFRRSALENWMHNYAARHNR